MTEAVLFLDATLLASKAYVGESSGIFAERAPKLILLIQSQANPGPDQYYQWEGG